MTSRAWLIALALGVAHPATAASGSTDSLTDSLSDSGARISAAVAALDGTEVAEARIDALAAAMSAHETALAGLRGVVFDAEDRERRSALDLRLRRDEIGRLAAALQTLSRIPAPAPGLHPNGPLGAARAATMLARMTPALRSEAEELAAQLREIAAARASRQQALDALASGLAALASARGALVAALARRAPPAVAQGAAVPVTLLRDAETLSALAERLAALGGAAQGPQAALEPPALNWPVAGRVLRAFAEPDAAGVRRSGLLLAAAPLAPVTAPVAARVRYAGPFLDYGYVVALEPRADVLVVLAGLATLETRSGAVVRDGAVLGLLGGRVLEAQEYLMLGHEQSGETPGETLYIEVRHGQGAVDPMPLFIDRKGLEAR